MVAIMTPEQCKMARVGLGKGVRDLALEADVSTNTITRFEGGAELKARTVAALQQALEAMGATFLEADERGPGVRVRLKSPPAAPAEEPAPAPKPRKRKSTAEEPPTS